MKIFQTVKRACYPIVVLLNWIIRLCLYFYELFVFVDGSCNIYSIYTNYNYGRNINRLKLAIN